MATSVLVLLALLYTDGRDSVEGATRFQKLVFLTQEETDVPPQYDYHADRFGPSLPSVHASLDELQRRGLLERETVLDLDRLFDHAARSEHLEPEDPSEQFVGTAPGEWKQRNSSAKDLFEV